MRAQVRTDVDGVNHSPGLGVEDTDKRDEGTVAGVPSMLIRVADVEKASPVVEAKFVRFCDQVCHFSGPEPGCQIEEIECLPTLANDRQGVHARSD